MIEIVEEVSYNEEDGLIISIHFYKDKKLLMTLDPYEVEELINEAKKIIYN